MGQFAVLALAAALVGCAPADGERPARPGASILVANLAAKWADGAEVNGVDDTAMAVVEHVRALGDSPRAILLTEACESHAVGAATALGPEWQAFFVATWPGESGCFRAPGAAIGLYGNAVLVRDATATELVVPSCNDDGATDLCIPNWEPPAEQRRAVCAVGGTVTCVVHLDPIEWDWHAEQLTAVGEVVEQLRHEHDTVVGGDFNDSPTAVDRAMAAHARTPGVLTYPASRPRHALDQLLVSARSPVRVGPTRAIDLGRCAHTTNPDGRCSDHLALLASITTG